MRFWIILITCLDVYPLLLLNQTILLGLKLYREISEEIYFKKEKNKKSPV